MDQIFQAQAGRMPRSRKHSIAGLAALSLVTFGAPLVMTGCAVSDGQETAGQYVDDTTITTKVKSEIASQASVSLANQVSVETGQGIVQLSGFVPTTVDKDRAEDIAMSVTGVRSVKNDLIVQ